MGDSSEQSAATKKVELWVRTDRGVAVGIPVAGLNNADSLLKVIFKDNYIMNQLGLSTSPGPLSIKLPKNFQRSNNHKINKWLLNPENDTTLAGDCPISLMARIKNRAVDPFLIQIKKQSQRKSTEKNQIDRLCDSVKALSALRTHNYDQVTRFSDYISIISKSLPPDNISNDPMRILKDIRHEVCQYYGMFTKEDRGLFASEVLCHMLGRRIDFYSSQLTYIFPETYDDKEYLIGRGNISDPRNTLILFKPIGIALQEARLCFVWIQEQQHYVMRILDPNLKRTTLRSEYDRFFDEDKQDCLPEDPFFDQTFAMFENKPLDFSMKPDALPFKRSMQFRAQLNCLYATKYGWIDMNDLPEINEDID